MNIDPAATAAIVIDIWNGAPVERLSEVLAPDYRGHMLHLEDGERDANAYAGLVERFRTANPGTIFRVVAHIPGDAGLVSRLEARRVDGSSGTTLIARGINISRFDGEGRLAEEWAIWSNWMDEV